MDAHARELSQPGADSARANSHATSSVIHPQIIFANHRRRINRVQREELPEEALKSASA